MQSSYLLKTKKRDGENQEYRKVDSKRVKKAFDRKKQRESKRNYE